MKKIISVLCLVLTFSLADSSKWESVDFGNKIIYYTYSSNNGYDMFGFIKLKGFCDKTFMYLSLHNDNKNLEKFDNKIVKLDFETKKVKFTIKVTINVYKQAFLSGYEVYPIYASTFLMNDKFIKLLKNSKTIKISINPNQKIAKYFKNQTADFNLNGFSKTYELGYKCCIKK